MSKRRSIKKASEVGVLTDVFDCGVVAFFISLVTKLINTYPMTRLKHPIMKVPEFGAEGRPSTAVGATAIPSVDSSAYAMGSIAAHATNIVYDVRRTSSNSLADVQVADQTVNVALGEVSNIDSCVPSSFLEQVLALFTCYELDSQ